MSILPSLGQGADKHKMHAMPTPTISIVDFMFVGESTVSQPVLIELKRDEFTTILAAPINAMGGMFRYWSIDPIIVLDPEKFALAVTPLDATTEVRYRASVILRINDITIQAGTADVSFCRLADMKVVPLDAEPCEQCDKAFDE